MWLYIDGKALHWLKGTIIRVEDPTGTGSSLSVVMKIVGQQNIWRAYLPTLSTGATRTARPNVIPRALHNSKVSIFPPRPASEYCVS